ncbi:MAG: PepSY-like domain-containing protein [Parafilimonas sp.]|nr:PepSY-like domain-containing protein [Parafilimonas sp.]
MKHLFAGMILFATISCSAQNVPSAVKTAFEKNFPNTTVKKWDKEDGNYEANFSKDGKTMSATFDAAGKWLETETDINVSELPKAVADYVQTNYKGASIKEAAIISNPTSSKMYEAEVKGKDLLFDENGKFLKEEQD